MVAEATPRGPPRLLTLLMLTLLALASIYAIFGIQLCRNYYSGSGIPSSIPSGIVSRRHEQMPSAVSWRDSVSDAESGVAIGAAANDQGLLHGRVWSPVQSLRALLPFATPRDGSYYRAPVFPGRGFLFTTIRGELHEIHAAVCDLVVIARLLNATIVLPKIQGAVSVKGGGSKVESFSYLYDEQQFIAALKRDVRVVKRLPVRFRTRTSLQKQPVKTPARSSPVQYYLDEILPALAAHGACGLVFSDGGGLQSLLPPELVEYQRLRCRVAFHALRFRREIQDLGVQLVRRLEAHGRPYVVVHFGLERDVLAHHGCAELFQDLQTESIQLQRSHFLRTGNAVGDLDIDSQKQRHSGLCPLMPAEVGLLLEAFGFPNDTRIYVAGAAEITGGQRLLLPLRSMYPNLEDRFTMSSAAFQATTNSSLTSDDGVVANALKKLRFWRRSGGRAPARMVHSKGWWRSVGDCESDTENFYFAASVPGEARDVVSLRDAALDYVVALEANTYLPAFDRDRHGFPSIASLIAGHRLYQSASLKTFRPNRSVVAALVDEYPHEHADNVSTSWGALVRRVLLDSLTPDASSLQTARSDLFLAHPVPECACRRGAGVPVPPTNTSPRPRADNMWWWEGVTVCLASMVGQ